MEQHEKDTIAKAFCDVLETMCFMFGDVIDKDDVIVSLPEEIIISEIQFTGKINGSLSTIIPVDMCLELCANTIGKDSDEALKIVRASDSAKELLNITCGNVITSLFGDTEIFDLMPPEVSFPDKIVWDEFINNPDSIFFQVDDWIVALKAVIKK